MSTATQPFFRRAFFRHAALAALALIALTGQPPAASSQQAVTRIAAVVNEDIVTHHDVQARLRLVMAAGGMAPTPENAERLRAQVIRNLIDERLQMQEATRTSIRVTDQEIADNFTRLERQNNMPPGGFFAWLDQNEVPRSTATEQVKVSIAWSKLMRRRYARTVSVSEEEIDEAIQRRIASRSTVERRVAEIFLPIDKPSEEDEVRRLAERLIEQMRSGVRFTQIAQQFSRSATASAGGDLGWVQPGQLDPDLERVVNSLSPGELSRPIKLPSGYYILLLIERRTPGGAAAAPAVAVDENQMVSLRQMVLPVRPGSTPQELEQRRKSALELSSSVRDCADMATNREASGSLSGDLGRVRLGDMPDRLRQLIAAQPIGKATPPLQTEAGFVILMVCERDAAAAPAQAAAPSEKFDREEIAESLTLQRLENVARRVIRDLRRSAFIDIRG